MKERGRHLPDSCLQTQEEQTDRDESSDYFHCQRDLSAPAMCTDMSQVGVALFSSFQYIFYHFTFPGFPFVLINVICVKCIFFSSVSMDVDEEINSNWYYLPEPVLLHIFQYLSPRELLDVGLTCKTWWRISYDEFLWKDLFYRNFKIDSSIKIVPGMLLNVTNVLMLI